MNNSFGQFKIYPRGFLGAVLDPVLLKQGGYAPKTQRLQYDMTLFDPREERSITANLAIEKLFADLVRADISAQDFDFREKALIKILQAFGTQDFTGWYAAQFQSPSFGILHHQFLDDCLHYLWTGKRKVAIQTWDEILIPTQDREVLTNTPLSETARKFFVNSWTLSDLKNVKRGIPEIVQDWMTKPNGFSDLLYTAHILFGIK